MVAIRPTNALDYQAINAIGTNNYPKNYYEDDESFESKMRGYPDGCFVADLDGIVGYVISFPYNLGKPYPINEKYVPIKNPNCYYIHDLCVLPEFRKKGIAKKLAEKAMEARWTATALVAVMGSENFWKRMGFLSFMEIDYCGSKAAYMLRIE